MKKIFLGGLLILSALTINAQNKKKKDRAAIKKMCGCYEVTFNFAETFNFSKDSLYKPSKTKTDKALEWAGLIVDENDKISIQHLLQVGNPANPHIVKHWRQDWLYENTDFYMFNGNNNWLYKNKPKSEVKKQWTQKVYQVDDSPRYEGSGTWVHVDGKSYWENTTDAPLPRREYTKRSDYNVTERGNRHEITNYGWLHDQDNKKIIREEGKKDIVIAHEKGYNTYVKVDDNKCKAAQDWWKKNSVKWQKVRSKWDEVYGRNTNLSLETKVNNKPLYKHLFSEKVSEEQQINETIESFVKK
ncbi:hypothetical protein SAMN05444344_0088 [Tenacibaculum mesophilum]|uniref:DKNYY family protein n=2 Tax=Tenacibaculum TaxID=104267 RepID=A0ABN5T217_9FLAO|nr:DUF6607 family protein [Tenacibaculum mesophilum]AZJ31258.1 hypothetical protein D6200_01200 [Tenacibaculum mesophilum]QFS29305.1 hypothetical protein F9Y86_13195 [Tenacibaculum mesophilum]SHF49071.1 hypothetical protein SAMN05444344_0088 [Tenacibaculum mesophilum]